MRPLLLPVLLLAACTGPDPEEAWEISDQVLQGVVDGEPFTFTAGDADAFTQGGDDAFYGVLAGEPGFEGCDYERPAEAHLEVLVPREPGVVDLDLDIHATFVTPDGGARLTMAGLVEVTAITGEEVAGGLVAEADDDNRVDGRFVLARCP